jgi:hypothetical protein
VKQMFAFKAQEERGSIVRLQNKLYKCFFICSIKLQANST